MVTATLKRARRTAEHSDSRLSRPAVIAVSAPDELRLRARRLLDREINFIASDEFRSPDAKRRILDDAANGKAIETTIRGRLPQGLPGHLARLCESKLLTADEERVLFRRMNYLKYRANARRVRLNPDAPNAESMDEIERLLAHATRVRDRIIQSNVRLVIAIVKKFVTPRHSFDALLSDGIVSLMQAVENFDYERGFRFSTYAYRAVARNIYRTIADQQKEELRFDAAVSEDLTGVPEQQRGSTLGEHEWRRMRALLGSMMDRLDRRERFILRGRFALGPHREVRTFQCLADKLGVSKERVRQLEQRAVAKLQALARQVDP